MPRSYPRRPKPQWRSEAREGTAPDRLFRKVGEAIRRARDAHAPAPLTQAELAEKAGISPTHLSDIERGLINITIASLTGIARGLGMKVHELLASADV